MVADAVARAAGQPSVQCQLRTHILVAHVHGRSTLLGSLRHRHEPVVWDYWFPHLAVAVDRAGRPDHEQQAKLAWANAHGVLYFSCQTNSDEPGRLDLRKLQTEVARWVKALAGGDEAVA